MPVTLFRYFFFFSSRRRHTRFDCDWSSDVCSSDLEPVSPHVRIRFTFTDSGPELRFTDQRTFGHMLLDRGGAALPAPIAHIAPDPLESAYHEDVVLARLRTRHSDVKRALLDQSLLSGVGNIYADEALWRARTHWAREAASLRPADASRLLAAVREVLTEALRAGGTSF